MNSSTGDPSIRGGPATSAGAAPGRAGRSRIWALVGRIPFTISYVVITVVLGLVFGTLWSGVEGKSWYPVVGYGLPAFQDGR